MVKIAFAAVAATFFGAAVAQAQTRGDHALRHYEATASYQGDTAHQDDSDQKVMGLSVPNGFRESAAIYGRSRAY